MKSLCNAPSATRCTPANILRDGRRNCVVEQRAHLRFLPKILSNRAHTPEIGRHIDSGHPEGIHALGFGTIHRTKDDPLK